MTRMWMGDPSTMCRNHLLGEHKELHQLLGQLRKKLSISGYIRKNCIEVSAIYARHEVLVIEMQARGYTHASHMPDQAEIDAVASYLPDHERLYRIDAEASDADRYGRCSGCNPEGIVIAEAGRML